MNRKHVRATTISQRNDAISIGNRRGMARRAKRNSSKRLRQEIEKCARFFVPRVNRGGHEGESLEQPHAFRDVPSIAINQTTVWAGS